MSNIKDSLLKFTRGVSKTSGELVKNTKLSFALSSEEEKLRQVYLDIGKKVHEIYQYGGTLGKFFDEKYSEIQQIESAITELRNQIDTIKGVKSCPECGDGIQRGASFCPKCGYQVHDSKSSRKEKKQPIHEDSTPTIEQAIGEQAVVEQPIPEQQFEEQASIKNSVSCRHCQSDNEPNSRFCLTCGRML